MIKKNIFNNIIERSKILNISTISELNYDESKEFEIKIDCETAIIITAPYHNGREIFWAANGFNDLVPYINKLSGDLYIGFVPRKYVETLEKIGFTVFNEWIDFFNNDIKNTNINATTYESLEFLSLNDAEEASDVTMDCWLQTRGYTGFNKKWFIEWLENNNVIIAKENGIIAGLVCVSIYAEGTILWIRNISIKPSYQGKGYGSLLMEKALCYGVHHRATRSFLHVDILNKKAINLYRKYGFSNKDDTGEIDMIRGKIIP